MAKLELRLYAREAQNKEGETFTAFKTVRNDGKFQDVKFRREIENVPVEDCYIVVDSSQVDMESSKVKRYPALWVHEIEEIKPLQFEKTKEQEEELEKLFG